MPQLSVLAHFYWHVRKILRVWDQGQQNALLGSAVKVEDSEQTYPDYVGLLMAKTLSGTVHAHAQISGCGLLTVSILDDQ